MRNDIKIKRLIKRYGLEGYGLYNLVLESIAENLCSEKPVPDLEETSQDIAEQYGGDSNRVQEIMSFMVKQGLFEIDHITGRILCSKIYKFIDKSQTRSTEIRKMIESYKTSVCHGQIETVSDIADRIDIDIDIDIELEEKRRKRFAPPSLVEVSNYMQERNSKGFTAEQFVDFYVSNGWKVGKNTMKDWRAAVRTWEQRNKDNRDKTDEVRQYLKEKGYVAE